MRVMQKFLMVLCCLSLTACGFHLRGPITLAIPLQSIYIEATDPYSQLVNNIKQYLQASHIHVAVTPADASTVLQIISETESQQLLSVGATQQTRQYNLLLTVVYQLKSPSGALLLPPQVLANSRPITVEANQILGGNNEANNLYDQMRRSIVYLLMTRLASHEVTALVSPAPQTIAHKKTHR